MSGSRDTTGVTATTHSHGCIHARVKAFVTCSDITKVNQLATALKNEVPSGSITCNGRAWSVNTNCEKNGGTSCGHAVELKSSTSWCRGVAVSWWKSRRAAELLPHLFINPLPSVLFISQHGWPRPWSTLICARCEGAERPASTEHLSQ
eukprot:scaffold7275_cov45-Attheya_sp.AAC.1